MRELTYEDLREGEDLGAIRYQLTQAKLAAYQEAIGDPSAALATIASKEYAYLLATRYLPSTRINARHEAWYSGIPPIGDTLTVTGMVLSKYIRKDRQFIVVETRTHDALGNEVVKAHTTLMLGALDRQR